MVARFMPASNKLNKSPLVNRNKDTKEYILHMRLQVDSVIERQLVLEREVFSLQILTGVEIL